MRKRSLIAGAALALALPFAACGDEESGRISGNDPELVAKADFIQAANAACEKRREEIANKGRRIFAKHSDQPDSPQARRELIEKAIAPGFEAEIRDLRALEPPAGEEEEVEEVITAIEEMVARTREDLAEDRSYPYRRTENIAAAYGLPDCGTP
ncbi:MAG TPA: hypothetical protein VEQ41_08425 [Solirubrobacterales bacterium]|nr:hypothetical protein [Solirubrobacterales bacterium]